MSAALDWMTFPVALDKTSLVENLKKVLNRQMKNKNYSRIGTVQTFEDLNPWHKTTISLDLVSCNTPTSFSLCWFSTLISFCTAAEHQDTCISK